MTTVVSPCAKFGAGLGANLGGIFVDKIEHTGSVEYFID